MARHLVWDEKRIEGNGRTMPDHFDPQVLKAFIILADEFQRIYNTPKI